MLTMVLLFSKDIGLIPCAREALLSGIAGGAAIGAVRFLSSKSECFFNIQIDFQTVASLTRGNPLPQLRSRFCSKLVGRSVCRNLSFHVASLVSHCFIYSHMLILPL